MSKPFRPKVKRRRDGEDRVILSPSFLDMQDANGVWWRRTVQTDGTFSTPTSMGTTRPKDGTGFKKS